MRFLNKATTKTFTQGIYPSLFKRSPEAPKEKIKATLDMSFLYKFTQTPS